MRRNWSDSDLASNYTVKTPIIPAHYSPSTRLRGLKSDPRLPWIASKQNSARHCGTISKLFGCGIISTKKRRNSTRVQLQRPTNAIAIINTKTTPVISHGKAAFAMQGAVCGAFSADRVPMVSTARSLERAIKREVGKML